MRNRFLMTTAAVALVASTGLVAAQDKKEGAAPAPAAQQSAPADKMAPPAATQKAPDAAKPQNAQTMKPDAKPSAGQAQAPITAGDKKVEGKSGMTAAERKGADDSSKAGADAKTPAVTQNGNGQSPAKAGVSSPATTTGQGAAGARANLTAEQRTTIKTVIKEQKVTPATNVNFSISVGTRVPREVRHYPLPTRVIEVYPAWRGYEYILVGDQIVVIDPRTFEIVAVLEA